MFSYMVAVFFEPNLIQVRFNNVWCFLRRPYCPNMRAVCCVTRSSSYLGNKLGNLLTENFTIYWHRSSTCWNWNVFNGWSWLIKYVVDSEKIPWYGFWKCWFWVFFLSLNLNSLCNVGIFWTVEVGGFLLLRNLLTARNIVDVDRFLFFLNFATY